MSLPHIIKDLTHNGLTIVNFLIDVMEGRLPGFDPRLRLDAARLLTIYMIDENQVDLDRGPLSASVQRSLFSRPRTRRRPPPIVGGVSLVKLVLNETDNGRLMIRFFIDVMDGKIDRARPHHRMAAAKELLMRGFGKCPHRRLQVNLRVAQAPQTTLRDQRAADELMRMIAPYVEEREEQQRIARQQAESQPQTQEPDPDPSPEPSPPEDPNPDTTIETDDPEPAPDTATSDDPHPSPQTSISLTPNDRHLRSPNTHARPTFNHNSHHY